MRFILFFLVFSLPIYSQSIDPETLRAILAEGGEGTEVKNDDEYESFIQNNYSNTVRLLDRIDKDTERDLFYTSLAQSRIELASKLCSKDKRACFLIDEYQNYKEGIDEGYFNEDELRLFGLDVFAGYPLNLDSFRDLPLPQSYRLKVGDKVSIQVSGIQPFSGDVQIDASGSLSIGDLGIYKVSGMTVSEASKLITDDILRSYTGSDVYIGLLSVNPKNIFVLGNVNNPGSYGVNAFATAINALISGGGFKKNSSLRTIKVMSKEGEKVIDLYDFLINGDTSADVLMQDGDSVLVRGLKNQIMIYGEINRPAIYEIIDGETLEDALSFGLGFRPEADKSNVLVNRRDDLGNIRSIMVSADKFASFQLSNGDKIVVNKVMGSQRSGITITGAIRNPGTFNLENSANLSDFINLSTDLLDNTYLPFALIKRFNDSYGSWSYIKFDLLNSKFQDLEIKNKDEIIIFSKSDIEFLNSSDVIKKFSIEDEDSTQINPIDAFSNAKLIDAISENQSMQTQQRPQACLENFSLPVKTVSDVIRIKFKTLNLGDDSLNRNCTKTFNDNPNLVPYLLASSTPLVGNVLHQGLYPVSDEVTATQLFYATGGSILGDSENLIFEVLYDKNSILANASNASGYNKLNFVNIKIAKNDINQGFVTLAGEVNFPGEYAIRGGETLSSLYKRAGGLTSQAYPRGGILTRDATMREERRVLLKAQKDLGEVISNAALNGYLNQNPTDLVQLISLISTLSNSEALGRIVTEMDPALIRVEKANDTVLQPGDKIYIPRINNTVTIVGNVLNPITVPYNPSYNALDFIDLAGGFNKSADKKMTYIIFPNGTSKRSNQGRFFGLLNDEILPGSTIIVPRRATSDNLAIVRTISPILADLSVTAASINAIGN